MEKVTLVITDYQYEHVEAERAIAREAGVELLARNCKTEREVIEAVRDADAVITQYCDINAAVIAEMRRCKVIVKYGIGTNNIDSEAAARKGIYACNVPDYGTDEVANHVVAMLLALAKKLNVITDAFRHGDWGYGSVIPLYRIAGSTLGLVGFGRIPMSVARKMLGFEVNVIAYDPYVSAETAKAAGVELVDFDTLCAKSDFISIHCPLTAQTTHLFNRKTFQMMKKTAFLINTARGPVIRERDLIEALEAGEIAGAGLDVFEVEPLDRQSKLLTMKNVIATPHIAWYSEQAIQAVQRKAAEEAVNVLKGNAPFNPVNKPMRKACEEKT